MFPSACSYSKCKRKVALCFLLLRHDVFQLRNMLEHERSTESLKLLGLASFLGKVTLSSLDRSPLSMPDQIGFLDLGFVSLSLLPFPPRYSQFKMNKG